MSEDNIKRYNNVEKAYKLALRDIDRVLKMSHLFLDSINLYYWRIRRRDNYWKRKNALQ